MSFSAAGRPIARKRPSAGRQAVAAHYDAVCERASGKRRTESPAYAVRACNNAVKRALLQVHGPRPEGRPVVVADFCCGRGGDLHKWAALWGTEARVLGVDISLGSVTEAVRRYNEQRARGGQGTPRCTFWRGDVCAPVFWQTLPRTREWDALDLVTCHFAVHYMWRSEKCADDFMRNVACRLRRGGKFVCTTVREGVLLSRLPKEQGSAARFGNALYSVRFDEPMEEVFAKFCTLKQGKFVPISYTFSLVDCVDACREFVVPRAHLLRVAERHGLRCVVEDEPFSQTPQLAKAVLENAYVAEREVTSLYSVFVFEKQ